MLYGSLFLYISAVCQTSLILGQLHDGQTRGRRTTGLLRVEGRGRGYQHARGGRQSEAAMTFFKLVFLGSDEDLCVDAFNSCTIPFRTLIVPLHSVSSCSALKVLTPT